MLLFKCRPPLPSSSQPGEADSLLPVSVQSVLSIQHSSSRYPVFKITLKYSFSSQHHLTVSATLGGNKVLQEQYTALEI